MNKEEKLLVLMSTLVLVLVLFVISVVIAIDKAAEPKYYSSEVFFSDTLTDKEQVKILRLINEVDDRYITFVKSISFTANRSDIERFCRTKKDTTLGCNFNDGVLIYYYDDDALMREAIAHEILHSIIPLSERSHKVIYDLGHKQVVFRG